MKTPVRIVLILAALGFVVGVGYAAAKKVQVDKVDSLAAIKFSRAVARINAANTQMLFLQTQANQVAAERAPSLEEARAFCKANSIELDDVISGKVVVADDGTITRKEATAEAPKPSAKPATPAGVKP
jgi:hypothetical protein